MTLSTKEYNFLSTWNMILSLMLFVAFESWHNGAVCFDNYFFLDTINRIIYLKDEKSHKTWNKLFTKRCGLIIEGYKYATKKNLKSSMHSLIQTKSYPLCIQILSKSS